MFLLDGEINTVRFLCHQQIIRLYIGANVQMGLTATISDLLHHRAGLPADLDDEEEAALLQKTADWSAPAARLAYVRMILAQPSASPPGMQVRLFFVYLFVFLFVCLFFGSLCVCVCVCVYVLPLSCYSPAPVV